MKSIKETSFYKCLEFDIERQEAILKEIAEDILASPAAISWGPMSTMFSARAELTVLLTIKRAVNERDAVEAIQYLDNVAGSAVRSGFPRSSNPVSNLLDSDLAEAWYRAWVDEESFGSKKRGLIKAYEEVE